MLAAHPSAVTLLRRTALGLWLLLLVAACSGPDDGRLEDAQAVVPEPLDGNTVTVSGTVTEVAEGGAFLIDGGHFAVGDAEQTLVLDDGNTSVAEGDLARVRGTIDKLNVGDLDDGRLGRYGEQFLSQFDGQYVLEAQQVVTVDAPGRSAEALEEALDDPDTVVRETLTFSAKVEELLGPQVFWIAGTGEEGVAVLTTLRPQISVGDVVALTGTVRRFDPADIQRSSGITLRSDVADEVRQRVDSGVVFVAEQITLVNSG